MNIWIVSNFVNSATMNILQKFLSEYLFSILEGLYLGMECWVICTFWASQMALMVKNSLANVGDIRNTDSIPGSRRFPGGGHGNPLQDSCLENPMDRGTWRATVHCFEKSQTRLPWPSMHTSMGILCLMHIEHSSCLEEQTNYFPQWWLNLYSHVLIFILKYLYLFTYFIVAAQALCCGMPAFSSCGTKA